jgi:hypothetical protein
MGRRRLGQLPNWLSISEIRLVLEAFCGAFDSESTQPVLVSPPWGQRRYPLQVTVGLAR